MRYKVVVSVMLLMVIILLMWGKVGNIYKNSQYMIELQSKQKAILKEQFDKLYAPIPQVKIKDFDGEQNQLGYIIKINRIEFTNDETRVYLYIANKTDDEINFHLSESTIIQGNKHYKIDSNFQARSPQPKSELSPGSTSEGILLFGHMDSNCPIKLILKGSSDDPMKKINPFIFEIK